MSSAGSRATNSLNYSARYPTENPTPIILIGLLDLTLR
jgi:hypothetical protein